MEVHMVICIGHQSEFKNYDKFVIRTVLNVSIINTQCNAIYEYFKEPHNDALCDATKGYCKVLNCPPIDSILEKCEQDTIFNKITDRFIHEIETTFDFDEEKGISQEVSYRSMFGS